MTKNKSIYCKENRSVIQLPKNVNSPHYIFLVTVLVASMATPVSATIINWNNPNAGDWFSADNWDSGIPTTGDIVSINFGSVNIAFGNAENSETIIGNEVGSTGVVTVSGGKWTSNILWMGKNGSGMLDITGGEVVTIGCIAGDAEGSASTITISGGKWTNLGGFSMGREDKLIMNITGGEASTESCVIGSGSVVTVSGGKWLLEWFAVGNGRGGELNITGNGIVSSDIADVGNGLGMAKATISGGEWINTSNLYIGRMGDGTLDISGSGQVSAISITLGGVNLIGEVHAGIINLNGGTLVTNGFTKIGDGKLNLNGGTIRSMADSVNFFVGLTGSDINIQSGGVTIDTNGHDITVTQGLNGEGGLTKTGEGNLTLHGVNGYMGSTAIVSGTLTTNVSNNFASGAGLTLDSGTNFHGIGTTQIIKHLNMATDSNWIVDTTTIEGNAIISGNFASNLINSGTVHLGNVYGIAIPLTDVSQSGLGAWGKVDNRGTLYLLSTQSAFGWGTFVNNGHLDFVNAGNKVYTDSLSGVGSMRMDVDALSSTNSDELIIRTGGNIDPNTRQQLQLTNVTANPGAVTRNTTFTVVSNEDGTPLPDGSITGRVDIGVYTFDVGTAGNNGRAVAIGYSSIGQVIVNMTGTGAMATGWFSQLDNLLKRMGDLRLMAKTASKVQTESETGNVGVEEKSGKRLDLWVRSYGQQINTDLEIHGMSKFREYQYGADVGLDKIFASSADSNTALGVFTGYQGTTRRFRDEQNGHGDTDSVYAGMYATWMHDQGWYIDAVVKGQYFKSDYDANLDHGDFDNYGIGASIELGKQWISEKGWFIEPSVQFAYTHIFTENYKTHQDLGVQSTDADIYRFSGAARCGKNIVLGDKSENGIIQPYAKLGIEEQISDGGQIRVSDEKWRPNTDGTRGIVGAGLNWQIDTAQQIHLDYEAAFGEKYDKPWGVNLGYTVRF